MNYCLPKFLYTLLKKFSFSLQFEFFTDLYKYFSTPTFMWHMSINIVLCYYSFWPIYLRLNPDYCYLIRFLSSCALKLFTVIYWLCVNKLYETVFAYTHKEVLTRPQFKSSAYNSLWIFGLLDTCRYWLFLVEIGFRNV